MDDQLAREMLGFGTIKINMRLIKMVDGDVELAFFLGFLIEEDYHFEKENRWNDGWFYSDIDLKKIYRMADDYVKRLMEKAVDKGFVEISMEPGRGRQWIKINYDKLKKLI